MQIILYLLLGACTGVLSGIFGIGGGILLVPALVFIFHYSLSTASGTSLVALLLPVGALGAWEYYNLGKLTSENIKFGLIISVGILIGTFFGAKIAANSSTVALQKTFAVFLVLVAYKFWTK